MGKGSVKKFISKQTARTFKIVPRPASEGSDVTGDRVFVEITPGAQRRELVNIEDAYIDVEKFEENYEDEDEQKVVGEAAKYGILYDDRSYDYTKHLRRVGETPGSVLVTAPTESKIKEEDYLEEIRQLDQAVYKDIKSFVSDPAVLEVLVALDDEAYCEEDAFGDDLVSMLNQEDLGEDNEEDIDIDDTYCSSQQNDAPEHELDEVLQEYEDMDEDDFFEEQSIPFDLKDSQLIMNNKEADKAKSGFAEVDLLRKALLADAPLRIPTSSSDFDSDEYFINAEESSGNEDLYSVSMGNQFNRPQVISEIKLSRKTGMPILVTGSQEPSTKALPASNLGEKRSKVESQEDKKNRKASLKEQRKERRSSKKETRLLFSNKPSVAVK